MNVLVVFALLGTMAGVWFQQNNAGKYSLPQLRIQTNQSQAKDSYTIYLPIVLTKDDGYYVSPTGSDGYPGTISAPWKTLQYAIDHVPDGSTIHIRGGEYSGFTITRSGITLSNYPGEVVYVRGDGSNTYTARILNSDLIDISGIQFHDNQNQYSAGVYVENSMEITLENNSFFNHRGFGIVTKNVSNVLIENNDLYDNANAIEIRYGSDGVVIKNNAIHHNSRPVDGGRSAIGVTFYRTTGPVTAIGNRLWENHTTEEPDPGGAAFEIYASSNVTMTGNVMWDNETVLETGTDGQASCSNITFTRNVAYRVNRQQGLILRCASNSLIAHNTFDGLDEYVFYLTHLEGEYGGSVEGLKILNNVAVNGRVYSIGTDLPASVEINHNLVYNPGSSSIRGDYLAYVKGEGNTKDLLEFQVWTGYDLQSISLPPIFIDPLTRDYRLQPVSPAIDIGKSIGEPFIGTAPDGGVFEFAP